ncbi:hypothetical protein BaRGS_00025264 [Batillaria attramentaria]|uniref:Uncharacterized protein n=1 Tax=Batillaria attramentaria TaxID=370345 RepID=A0ABD0K8N2_9CAEN
MHNWTEVSLTSVKLNFIFPIQPPENLPPDNDIRCSLLPQASVRAVRGVVSARVQLLSQTYEQVGAVNLLLVSRQCQPCHAWKVKLWQGRDSMGQADFKDTERLPHVMHCVRTHECRGARLKFRSEEFIRQRQCEQVWLVGDCTGEDAGESGRGDREGAHSLQPGQVRSSCESDSVNKFGMLGPICTDGQDEGGSGLKRKPERGTSLEEELELLREKTGTKARFSIRQKVSAATLLKKKKIMDRAKGGQFSILTSTGFTD